jgi:mandelate racemase
VGDDIILMSDFNQGLSFNAALRRLHQLDDQGLEWFEEPSLSTTLQALHGLRTS